MQTKWWELSEGLVWSHWMIGNAFLNSFIEFKGRHLSSHIMVGTQWMLCSSFAPLFYPPVPRTVTPLSMVSTFWPHPRECSIICYQQHSLLSHAAFTPYASREVYDEWWMGAVWGSQEGQDGGVWREKKVRRTITISTMENLRLWFFLAECLSHFRNMTHILTSALSSSKWLWETHTWKILIRFWVILDHYNSCLWRIAVQYLIARGKWIHASRKHCYLQKPRRNNLATFASSSLLVVFSNFFFLGKKRKIR